MQKNVMGWLVLKCLPGFDNCSYSSQPRKSLRQINHETQLIAPVIFHIHVYGKCCFFCRASERLCWKEQRLLDAVNASRVQCLKQGGQDGERFYCRVKYLWHESSKSVFSQSRSCLRQMANGQQSPWAQEGRWFCPDVFPCPRRALQRFSISSQVQLWGQLDPEWGCWGQCRAGWRV